MIWWSVHRWCKRARAGVGFVESTTRFLLLLLPSMREKNKGNKTTKMVISPSVAIPSVSEVEAGEHTLHQHHIHPPYLIITNISKRQNVRNLLQIAAAYGVPMVFIVGQKKFVIDLDDDDDDGDDDKVSHGIQHANNDNDKEDNGDKNVRHQSKTTTDIPPNLQQGIRNGKLTIRKFDKLDECVAYIKRLPCCVCVADDHCVRNDTNITTAIISPTELPTRKIAMIPIVGVEIDNSSINLEEEPFSSFFSSSSCNCNSIAFMMGNEGSGMSSKQMSICDGFIRISQYGGGTASLNVSVAAALVLHRYHHWRRGEVVKSIVRCDG